MKTPPLYRLLDADNVDWEAVTKRLKSHPQDVCVKRHIDWAHENSELEIEPDQPLLHYMIVGDEKYEDMPIETFQAIIDAHPDALMVRDPNHWGDTPLHLACMYSSTTWKERIIALVAKCPEAAFVKNEFGHLPLHQVFGFWGNTFRCETERNRTRMMVIEILHEINPIAITTPINGTKDRNTETVWERTCSEWNDGAKDFTESASEKEFNERWQLTLWVLQKYWKQTSLESKWPVRSEFLPLHLFFRQDLLYVGAVMDRFVSQYAEEAKQRDENGNLPLHILLSSRKENHSLFQEDLVTNTMPVALRLLLDIFSHAAGMPNKRGRLPLQLGLERGWRWDGGIDTVTKSAPRALVTRDKVTRLYPFMTAAVGDASDLSTVFALIREGPVAVEQASEFSVQNGNGNHKRSAWGKERAQLLAENAHLKEVLSRVGTIVNINSDRSSA